MTAKAASCFLAGLVIASSALAQEMRKQPNTPGPSALESHAERMEHDAIQDIQSGNLGTGWFIDLDIVFPTDKEEYEAVGKYALMVFALFSDDRTDLPLAHAYVGGLPLKCLKSVPRDVPSASAMAKAFGKFRADTLCVLPMDVERRSSRITIDFGKIHQDLEVSSYPFEEPDFVKADIDPVSAPMPDPMVLEKFVSREYPGFGFQVRP
jgi:hypothetical protein